MSNKAIDDVYEQIDKKRHQERAIRSAKMFFILSELMLDNVEQMKGFHFYKQKIKNMVNNLQKELESEIEVLNKSFLAVVNKENPTLAEDSFFGKVKAVEDVCKAIHECKNDEEHDILVAYIRNWNNIKSTLTAKVRAKQRELENPKSKIITKI